jgi:hypothetical protein
MDINRKIKSSQTLERIEAAQAASFDADDHLNRASKRRLIAYLALPAKEQLDCVHDPTLNANDRIALMQSVGRALSLRSPSSRRSNMTRLSLFLYRHIIAIPALAAVTCLAATLVVQAWLNTGLSMYFPSEQILVFQMPTGVAQPIAFSANTRIPFVRKDGDRLQARIWMKKWGYVFSNETFATPSSKQ